MQIHDAAIDTDCRVAEKIAEAVGRFDSVQLQRPMCTSGQIHSYLHLMHCVLEALAQPRTDISTVIFQHDAHVAPSTITKVCFNLNGQGKTIECGDDIFG